jgi:hypothetical protein
MTTLLAQGFARYFLQKFLTKLTKVKTSFNESGRQEFEETKFLKHAFMNVLDNQMFIKFIVWKSC